MAIFSKSVESARSDITKAETTLKEWETKAAAVRKEAQELEDRSGSLILADESQAEKISIKIQTLERKARAFDSAASEASIMLRRTHTKRLEAEAREEDQLADQAQKRLDAHNRAVDALLAQLKDLDGCDYVPAETAERKQMPKWYFIHKEVLRHRTRAAVIKYFLRFGKPPRDYYDLNNDLGTKFNAMVTSMAEADGLPPVVYEYRDSAIEFERVGA